MLFGVQAPTWLGSALAGKGVIKAGQGVITAARINASSFFN